MTTALERDLPATAAAPGDDGSPGFDEARAIAQALEVTLLFLAVVVLLVWAGVADAAARVW